MRFIVGSVLAVLLSVPAFAQVGLDAKGQIVVKDKAAKEAAKDASKDAKDAAKDAKADTKAAVGPAGVTLDKGGAHDCSVNAEPTLSGSKLTLVVTGTCTKVTVNGKDNNVTLESAGELTVTGDKNKVNAKQVMNVTVAGKENEVLWTATGKADQAEPVVKNTGTKNTVKRADAVVTAPATDAANKAAADASKDAKKDAKKEEKKAKKEVDGALKGAGVKMP